jgi:hypothetical protein
LDGFTLRRLGVVGIWMRDDHPNTSQQVVQTGPRVEGVEYLFGKGKVRIGAGRHVKNLLSRF